MLNECISKKNSNSITRSFFIFPSANRNFSKSSFTDRCILIFKGKPEKTKRVNTQEYGSGFVEKMFIKQAIRIGTENGGVK